MSYADLRRGRFSESGRAYLVTTVTAKRAPIFADYACARIVIKTMRGLHEAQFVSSLAWVLMPDHLHWLFVLQGNANLADVMRRLKGASAASINKHLGLGGALWQEAFHDHAVREDEDILALTRYVVANPLRAGLVEDIGAYPFWDAVWLDPLGA